MRADALLIIWMCLFLQSLSEEILTDSRWRLLQTFNTIYNTINVTALTGKAVCVHIYWCVKCPCVSVWVSVCVCEKTLSHPEITCGLFPPYPVWLRSLVITVPCYGSSLSLSLSLSLSVSLSFFSSSYMKESRRTTRTGPVSKEKRNYHSLGSLLP